jgi:hypothetical protein
MDGMSNDELEPRLREMATDYHRPPAPDREAMWKAIQARRAAGPPAAVLRELPLARRRWVLPVGLAALLALGFGLGRWTAKVPAPAGTVAGPATADLVHQVAAVEYLGRVEVFLTGFRSGTTDDRGNSSVPEQARRLLGTTRLLLDTPVGDDRRLRPLLEDLELVLAQIAQLPGQPDGDLDLITEKLDRQGTLARLRSKVSAGPMPASSQGAL